MNQSNIEEEEEEEVVAWDDQINAVLLPGVRKWNLHMTKASKIGRRNISLFTDVFIKLISFFLCVMIESSTLNYNAFSIYLFILFF